MKDPLKQEIRRILLGFIDYDEEEHIIAAERTEHLRILGLFNGSSAARLFGVAVRKRQFTVPKAQYAADICRDAFAHMGRRVSLDAGPELTAVFYSPLLFNPAVLTARSAGEVLEVCVYTSRTPTVRLNAAHAFRKWRQQMPDGLREKAAAEEDTRQKKNKRRKAPLRQRQKVRNPENGKPNEDAESQE